MNLQEEAVLIFGLRLMQLGSYCTARLQKVNAILVTLEHRGDALVLVSPYYQVKELRDHSFGQ
jgi:hypothetical protein